MKTVPRWARLLGPSIQRLLNALASFGRRTARRPSGCQTCPRRMGEVGPWSHSAGEDRWVSDRWHWTRALADRWRDATDPNFSGGTYWPAGFKPPRTCSFCGGVHPEDAVALIQAGWTAEGTDKGYKRYLHPPAKGSGYAASPVPPVKLYTMHFDAEAARLFNAALDTQGMANLQAAT